VVAVDFAQVFGLFGVDLSRGLRECVDVDRFQAAVLAGYDVEADLLSCLDPAVGFFDQVRGVHEQIRLARAFDEPSALLPVEPLDNSLSHFSSRSLFLFCDSCVA
jgi:hypothetical protein